MRKILNLCLLSATLFLATGCTVHLKLGRWDLSKSITPAPTPYCTTEKTQGTPFAGGDGSAGNPYAICTGTQLDQVRTSPTSYFILKADIDLQGITFTPFAHFGGQFDGDGKTIANFTATDTGGTGIALILSIENGASIKKLKMTGANISSTSGTAVLALQSDSSTITFDQIQISGTLNGPFQSGGFVGFANGPITISNSSANLALTAGGSGSDVGGFIGQSLDQVTISNSSIQGTFTGMSGSVGGFIGSSSGLSNFSNSSANVSITSNNNNIGSFIGFSSNTVTISDSSAQGTISASSGNSGGVLGYLSSGTVNMTNVSSSVSVSSSGSGYMGGLVGYSNNTSLATYDHCSGSGTVTGANVLGGLIGSTNAFTMTYSSTNGTVRGSSYGIGGLVGVGQTGSGDPITISDSSSSATVTDSGTSNPYGMGGLLGAVNGGSDAFVILRSHATGNVGSTINGCDEVGGLVGYVTGSTTLTVTDSWASGQITADYEVGGLLGSTNGTVTVQNSYATGNVISRTGQEGGLIGGSYSGSITLQKTYATGNVTATDIHSSTNIGGLIGLLATAGSVDRSYSLGNVTGYGQMGGFIGQLNSTSASVTNSYARGSVTGTDSSSYYIGGLIGSLSGGTISTSYSLGVVSAPAGASGVGNLVGDSFVTCDTDSTFWNSDTSLIVPSACGAAKTTAQLKTQSTFDNGTANWDFSSIWTMTSSDGYPTFQ